MDKWTSLHGISDATPTNKLCKKLRVRPIFFGGGEGGSPDALSGCALDGGWLNNQQFYNFLYRNNSHKYTVKDD